MHEVQTVGTRAPSGAGGGEHAATIGGLLEGSVRRFGPRSALLSRPRYRTEVWTYADLWAISGKVAAVVAARGIRRGDRVVVWAPNSPWWAGAYFGLLRLGAILVPLDVRSAPAYVERVVAQTEPALALLSRRTAADWRFPVPLLELEGLEAAIAQAGDVARCAVEPDDVAEILFTSGTTGEPKGVILSHRNITANVASAMQVIPNDPGYRLLSLLPLSHMLEQAVGLLLPLACGASIFYPSGLQSTLIFRDLQTQGITALVAVPQVLDLFMAAIEREVCRQGHAGSWRLLQRLAPALPMGLRRLLFARIHRQVGGRLEFLVSGGAPLAADLIAAWEALGLPVLQGYGATEASPILTGTGIADRRPGSVGKAVPGVRLRLAPDGEVLARGPNITRGYWRNPRATEAAFIEGWYRTGDLGMLDAQGYLRLHGRSCDRIALANGQNVYPADVEGVVREQPGVRDAVVLGLPSPRGAQVHAALLCDVGADPHAIVAAANKRLAEHQQIRGYTVWPDEDFPRTHTLKVRRLDVQHRLKQIDDRRSRTTAGPGPAIDASALRRLVATLTGMPLVSVAPAATLGEGCGLDSLGRVELLAAIEAELGAYLDEAQVTASTTIADLEALVAAQERATRPAFPAWPRSRPAVLARAALQRLLLPALSLIAPLTVLREPSRGALSGPALFVANHASHLDTPVVLRALGTAVRGRIAVAAAADYFFSARLRGAVAALGLNAFPFAREGNVRATLEHCARLLDEGWSILLYPEGTRSTTGALAPFKPGIGLLAVEMGVPVVPVRLHGLHAVLPKGRRLPRRAPARVHIGAPLFFAPGTGYEAATAAIERALGCL